ncbi:hypothetical protein FH972_005413 [Carpinus fangiana]|uniref:Fe2OG dioxygenase domain-containing protein n=1 Tax=Carpinus fangiana TaxID=176857 RepID=A0A5N6QP76_9ROSI|nr:hypothetical protein FH972_005413 [Carpinus fangiana]
MQGVGILPGDQPWGAFGEAPKDRGCVEEVLCAEPGGDEEGQKERQGGEPTIIPTSHEPDDKELTEWINQWPHYPPELREACQEYAQEMVKLAYKLMELVALSLGLPGDKLYGFFKDQTSFIRLNHYPPCPVPHLALGVGRHKDAGALTILAQDDVGGLEVKRKIDGEWIRVWSNDKYESVDHRVMVNSKRERFSIPFFFNPAHYTLVKPLEELTNEQNPAKYREYSWGKFITTKKRSNFQKLNVENIQIYHFDMTIYEVQ